MSPENKKKNILDSSLEKPKHLLLGNFGERLAQQKYIDKGFSILGANVFNKKGKRLGEIDFIAVLGKRLIFVEVKTRTGDSYEAAVGAVDFYKQKKLRSAILFYLRSNPEYANYFIQVDVCVVLVEQIDINKNSVIIIENVMEF